MRLGDHVIPVTRPWFESEEADAVRDVIASGWVAQGPKVAEFETAVADTVDARHGIALTSCTAGLHLALIVSGVGKDDEVVVPSFSFIATANAVVQAGATVVFADVDPVYGNVTVDTVGQVLTDRTRAVIAVHQCGVPAEIDELSSFCQRHGLVLIEDAACALGSRYRDQPIGSFSNLTAFSFHPRKVITTGEGGMLVTDSDEQAIRLRRLREHGMSISAASRHKSDRVVIENYIEPAFNYRMTDIQAAIGLVQLDRLQAIVERRRNIAAIYQEALAHLPLRTVRDPDWGAGTFQSFWVLLDDSCTVDRNVLLDELLKDGVVGRRGIMAAHLEPAYRGVRHAELPITEWLTERSLILPLFHEMTDSDLERVVVSLDTHLR
ncbi:DegT/DnrJ/EryC1/StrS family aminotransferase [bacterium]|nr:DegT/DnrJ/EryC1/StrS family aminotransferase [bacterium]